MAEIYQHEAGWECPKCHLRRGVDGHDPCLGELPGVKYACCGHGAMVGDIMPRGYIYFENGKVIRFEQLTEVHMHGEASHG